MISIIRGENRAYAIRRRGMPERIFLEAWLPHTVTVNILPGAGFDERNFVWAQSDDGAVTVMELSDNLD